MQIEDDQTREFKSMDDDPKRKNEFIEFQKIMTQLSSGNCSVGSIMGAMVYQISCNKKKRVESALNEDLYA